VTPLLTKFFSMHLLTNTNIPGYKHPSNSLYEAEQMNTKTLVTSILFASSLFVSGQALADKPNMSQEQLTKARAAAAQLNPPVDFDAMIKEADSLNVECTGDLTRKARIIICGQKIENAQIQAENARIKADTEATKARTEQLRKENARLDEENAELIRQVQQRIKENK